MSKDPSTAFELARHEAELKAGNSQELNKLWWEKLPMTYKDWAAEARGLSGKDAFRLLEKQFLDGNPFLAQFDFSQLQGKRVLEIGCGSGVASCLMARHGAQVTAVDLTEQAVAFATDNARLQGLTLDLRRMDAEHLDFPDATFDYVFSWGVIHHSERPESILQCISKVLKPGGRGLLMVYNKNSLRYWLKGLIWLVCKGRAFKGDSFESVQRHYTDGYYHKHYTKAGFRDAIEGAGLHVARYHVSHMSNRMIPLLPSPVVEKLKRSWGWFLIAEFEKPNA